MPMPPPRASTEPSGGQRRRREADQIIRALTTEGPADQRKLAQLVGATYWDAGRFDQALAWALAQGLVNRDAEGRLSAL